MYRQGDILIVPIADMAQGTPETNAILAYGEATGHHHMLVGTVEAVREQGEITMFRLVAPVTLTHEEHAPHTLALGAYQVIRQRQYARGEVRYVVD